MGFPAPATANAGRRPGLVAGSAGNAGQVATEPTGPQRPGPARRAEPDPPGREEPAAAEKRDASPVPIADPEEDPTAEADFASEHTDVTFADEQAGGPEGSAEPESPEGYAGMDRSRRHRGERDQR